jgi:tetratricopeptide (TPR) repeat protein
MRRKIVIIASILALLVLLVTLIIPHIKAERAKTKQRALLITLDYIHPSFASLLQFIEGKTTLTPSEWSNYRFYYKKVAEALPNLAEAKLFAGYCYFQTHDASQSLNLIKESAELNPSLFWSYYNLGLLFLYQHLYKEAAFTLNFALHIPIESSLQAIFTSKIYRDVLSANPEFNQQAVLRLRQGYQTASILLNLTLKLDENPSNLDVQKSLNALLSSLPLEVL